MNIPYSLHFALNTLINSEGKAFILCFMTERVGQYNLFVVKDLLPILLRQNVSIKMATIYPLHSK